jgi:hexosaminidase
LSQELSELGVLGLSALDAIESARPITAELREQELAHVDAIAAPHAELFLVVTPAVRALILAEQAAQ